ncbi:hypothetical protein [Occallatibacter riparius]|uniref:Uncharacterized protein n=1 Tax=Occallatibacter riparius TaxID=1002689 RepID=A0A9J7BVY9_9BACT|nr:hypothetical protein [Occallatibacter riparius]UWZ86871.1 hypothetical protein MOP44_13190 [Occallatibacter riparius]
MKKWLILPAAALSIFCLLVWWVYGLWPIASISGNLAARWDTWHGHYEVQGYGLPVPWTPEYAATLHDRYGIQHRAVTGCIVNNWILDRTDAYNRVSDERIRAKFGRDVVREAAREAEQNWQRTHADASKR